MKILKTVAKATSLLFFNKSNASAIMTLSIYKQVLRRSVLPTGTCLIWVAG